MERIEMENLIRDCIGFGQLALEDVSALAAEAEVVEVVQHGFVFREGDLADCVYIVFGGEIQFVAAGVPTAGARTMFGEVGFYPGRMPHRRADALANHDSVLLRIPYSSFSLQMIGRLAETLNRRDELFERHNTDETLVEP